MINFNTEKELREYISRVLEERIDLVISRRIAEGFLTNIKNDIVKEFEGKLDKVNALNRITEDIKILFGVE